MLQDVSIALALGGLVLLLSLCRMAGRHLPKEPGTGRCWHCGQPTESATGVCELCRAGDR